MPRTTRIPAGSVPAPALKASASDLLARLKAQSDTFNTLTATVDLRPTAGSVYSGIINEYPDVKGFILLKKPQEIRMIGLAPVVKTTIFDMVSDGRVFKLSIPPKQKFIVGKNTLEKPAKNTLENLRPQHILDALAISPIDPAEGKYSFEEAEDGASRYYVLTALNSGNGIELFPKRKLWFDRSDLELSRLQLYGRDGAFLEDVQYSGYHDFQGVRYPSRIEISRPEEDYRLAITIEKAEFNQPLPPEKFEMTKPAGAELVDLSDLRTGEEGHGK